ncbi:MAG TPA: DUF1080 domain-containing protein [Bryobacteraceae bacterium]|nr:DUF1080 domain-containing protein [Bryobacteraceae bacterium]
MIRTSVVLGCVAVCCLFAADEKAAPPIAPHKKIALFNGRNLDGWYTWLRENKYEDPKKVFTVKDGMIRISGEEWGGIVTKNSYRDYHLVAEWKWGGPNLGERKEKSRDSGILVHSVGADGAHSNTWMESIEAQIIEGGCGDFILVGGANKPSLTVETRVGGKNELYWEKGGKPVTKDSGRFDWFGRDPEWQDKLGFRGRNDVEKPVGEWNRSEVIADGDSLTNLVNGVVVNHGTRSSQTAGKIQIQSEGAEIFFRRIELLPVKKH